MKIICIRLAILFFVSVVALDASTIINKDFKNHFGKYTGAIAIYDMQADTFYLFNKERCNMRYTPFSTFKIPNSIIGLETGVIINVDSVYKWDTLRYPAQEWWLPQWKGMHTMRSAIKVSVVPFYRNLSYSAGAEKMQKYVNQFNYGNKDISSGVDTFWLNGSIKISIMEQIDFLVKFYNSKLGVTEKTTKAVKDILIQEKNEKYILSAKTGAGSLTNESAKARGWYVGYVETKNKVYFFAMNIDGESFTDILAPRIEITKAVLKALKIIE
jgi:beta-lactamase class D